MAVNVLGVNRSFSLFSVRHCLAHSTVSKSVFYTLHRVKICRSPCFSEVTATYFELNPGDSITLGGMYPELYGGTDGPNGAVLRGGATISFNPESGEAGGELGTGFRLCGSESPWLPCTEADRNALLRCSCSLHV